MTQLLEEAIRQVQLLPAEEQDSIASIILHELADERQWAGKFAKSHDQLRAMADRIKEQIGHGQVRQGGFDEL